MIGLIEWLRQVWPHAGKQREVIGEYGAIGRYALADIALRGFVWSRPPRTPGDIYGDGINEGRRLLATEIIGLAGADPAQLFALLERKPTEAPK